MVAHISGNNLGLDLTSFKTLGQQAAVGQAALGSNQENAYINIATGNLVVQRLDEVLISKGLDVAALRTYNSQGKLNDDNKDNWRIGFYRSIYNLTGTLNKEGSTITRVLGDGSDQLFTYTASRSLYVSTDGDNTHDTLQYNNAGKRWTWSEDGRGLVKETYDWAAGQGKLLNEADNDGNTTTYTYNSAGLITRVTDASGENTFLDYTGTNLTQVRVVKSDATTLTRVRYGYDTSNRLISVTVDLSPENNSISDGKTYVTNYTYVDDSNLIRSISQSDGTQLTFAYSRSAQGVYRIARVRDALDQLTTYSYDPTNRKTTVTDPLGQQTVYDYDTAGQLTQITLPAVNGVSATQQFTYSTTGTGNVTRTTDGLGNATDFAYSSFGNLLSQRDAMGNTVTYSYYNNSQVRTETVYVVPDPDGSGTQAATVPLTTRYVYDAEFHLCFILTPQGRVTEYRYNAAGQQTAQITYTGTTYNVSGLAENAAPTLAQMTTWVNASTTNKTKTERTDITYDLRGQISKTTTYANVDAAGNGIANGTQAIATYVYDQAGQLLKIIAPRSAAEVTQYLYDGLGRLLSTTNTLNQVTTIAYDDVNNKVATTLANGLKTTQAYDRNGRLISVQQSNASTSNLGTTRYFYDTNDRLRMTQNAMGNRNWLLYDEAGRKVADIDGNGSLTEYVYDNNHKIIQTIRYASAVTMSVFTVNTNGSPTAAALALTLNDVRPSATNAQKNWMIYDRAESNRLIKMIDPLGAVVEFKYDGAGRKVSQIEYANGLTNVASLGSAPSAASITPTPSAGDRTTRYFYDNDGLFNGILDAEGYLTEIKYDAAGREFDRVSYANITPSAQRATGTLTALRPALNAANDSHSYTLYNARGQIVGEIDAEGYLTEYTYDVNSNRTQTKRYANKALTVANLDSSTPLTSVRPALNNTLDQTHTWQYDALNRISLETDFEGVQTRYDYDTIGQLIRTTTAPNTTETRAINRAYDALGNLAIELTGNDSVLLDSAATQAAKDAIWAQHGMHYTTIASGASTA